MNLKEKLDRRALLIQECRDLVDKNESMSGPDQKAYDSKLEEIEKLSEEIQADNLALAEAGVTELDQATLDRIKPGISDYGINKNIKFYDKSTLKELRTALTGGSRSVEPLSLGKYMRGIITGDWSKAPAEQRLIGTGAGGGQWLIQSELSGILIPMALNKARVIEAGAKYVDMKQNTLIIPKITKMPETEFKGENIIYSKDTDVNFTGVVLEAKTLMSLVKISMELALDGHNVESIIETAMSQAVALSIDKNCIDGNGVGQPLGIVNTENVLTEDVDNVAFQNFDHFSSAFYKVEAENGTVTALIGPSSMFAELDLLKATDNNPLGRPESWEKYKRLSSNQLVNNAVIGDYSKLLIGMRNRATIDVSKDAGDSFEKLQVWIRIFTRLDSGISIPEHFCNIKNIGIVSS